HAGSIFSGVLGTMADIVVALFVAVYLAANPRVYTNGIVALLPHRARPRAREVLNELRRVLGLWILGKLLSMLVVGVATAIGLSLLGVPVALALGLLASLLDFIPYIGSILAAAPAVLIAFTQSPMLALEVSALFLAVHALDGYVLLPLVERKTVSLPPALTISAQVLMGLAFGLGGVALATPLTAVAEVLIQMLYVQDALHDTRTPPA
ncbi:AI-2E family transporter, partial [Bacillus pumilus]|uniref:AI-2E family transporter n=1 Tax=Bacillus pumilus TaxID=1408 RepID=UPI0010BE387B